MRAIVDIQSLLTSMHTSSIGLEKSGRVKGRPFQIKDLFLEVKYLLLQEFGLSGAALTTLHSFTWSSFS